MAIGHQDHGGIAVSIAPTALGRLHEVIDLRAGQVFPRPTGLVGLAFRRDCPILSAWRLRHNVLFTRMFPHPAFSYCPIQKLKWDTGMSPLMPCTWLVPGVSGMRGDRGQGQGGVGGMHTVLGWPSL